MPIRISTMILVTGATGFVGRSLVQALKSSGRTFKAYEGDIYDASGLKSAMADVDTVIHLASAERRNHAYLLEMVDVAGTEKMLIEALRAGPTRIIYLSRLNADPSSMFALPRVKGRAERLVKTSGLPYTIVRSATLFGQEDRFTNVIAALAAWTWPFVWLPGGGQVAVQPFWVEDLISCLIATLDRDDLIGETVEVAGDERMRYVELVRLVMITAGMRRIPFGVSPQIIRPLSNLLFRWWAKPPVTRYFIDRFALPEVAPLDSVLRIYGFNPARLRHRIAYLRQSYLFSRLFRSR